MILSSQRRSLPGPGMKLAGRHGQQNCVPLAGIAVSRRCSASTTSQFSSKPRSSSGRPSAERTPLFAPSQPIRKSPVTVRVPPVSRSRMSTQTRSPSSRKPSTECPSSRVTVSRRTSASRSSRSISGWTKVKVGGQPRSQGGGNGSNSLMTWPSRPRKSVPGWGRMPLLNSSATPQNWRTRMPSQSKVMARGLS